MPRAPAIQDAGQLAVPFPGLLREAAPSLAEASRRRRAAPHRETTSLHPPPLLLAHLLKKHGVTREAYATRVASAAANGGSPSGDAAHTVCRCGFASANPRPPERAPSGTVTFLTAGQPLLAPAATAGAVARGAREPRSGCDFCSLLKNRLTDSKPVKKVCPLKQMLGELRCKI
ncbi:Hypothetical predicted protein [Podarcis lilfordi]|uniref:Uncharacterized protein n=1 Tax=Podarcis lilfordi TaxID=74358 RepID=A0AA35P797_9SAUR|nr:Hypothetical predicted protein [Podarcis lilfordi]